MKRVFWLGKTNKSIREFPKQARDDAGYQLFRVQQGLDPTDWKSMPSVGAGAMEIRVHDPFEHRIIYVAKFEEGIYVLHAFPKKTQKTSPRDLEIAQKAYKNLLSQRRLK